MTTRKHYSNDPKWITARHASACSDCGRAIHRGDRIFWFPLTKAARGSRCNCATTAAADFEARAFDEDTAPAVW